MRGASFYCMVPPSVFVFVYSWKRYERHVIEWGNSWDSMFGRVFLCWCWNECVESVTAQRIKDHKHNNTHSISNRSMDTATVNHCDAPPRERWLSMWGSVLEMWKWDGIVECVG